MGDVTDQEIQEMLQRLRQERAGVDAANKAYLKNNPNRGLLVQLGDSIDKFLTGRYQRDPGPYQATRNFGEGYKKAELAAGDAAEDWRPGAGFPGQQVNVIRNNEPDAQASEMERMRQQYGAGASFWNTDEGKDLLLDTMSNQYTGDQAGLPGFYQDQVKAGLGQLDMIKKALGYEEGSAMAKWADTNPALALREYNKRQPNSYSGTGPSDEEIKAAMEAGQFSPSAGSPNPLGETGMARESNTAQTAEAQPVERQAINNDSLNEIQAYMDTAVPGLGGKQMLSQNMMNLLRRQGRN